MYIFEYLLHQFITANEQILLAQLHFRLESSIRLLLLKSMKLKVANLLIEQDKVDEVDTTNTELIDEQKSSLPKI